MIATCQFCKEMLKGRELPDQATPEQVSKAYRNLSMLVANHMSSAHPQETGAEITMAMTLSGGAIAMRYVTSSDPRLDSERAAMGQSLADAFNPAPPAPLVTLATELPKA